MPASALVRILACLLLASALASCGGAFEPRSSPNIQYYENSAAYSLYDRPTNVRVRSLAERDTFIKSVYRGDNFYPALQFYDALDIRAYTSPGWYPFGLPPFEYHGSLSLQRAKSGWSMNYTLYRSIDDLQPNDDACIGSNFKQCIKNISASLVVATVINDYIRTCPEPILDVNGKIKYSVGACIIIVRLPDDTSSYFLRRVKITYGMVDEVVSSIDIMPLYDTDMFRLERLSTQDEFKRTRIYPIFLASAGGELCPENEFYRFIYNDLSTTTKESGDSYSFGRGEVRRVDTTSSKPRVFCGYSVQYARGSQEVANARSYRSAESEAITIKRASK